MISQLPASIIASLVEEALDAVVIIDEACIIRYVNPAMQHLSGFAPGEIVGQSLNGLLPEALAALHDGHVRQYTGASDGQSSVLGRVRDFAIRHRTGAMIPIALKALDLGVTAGVRYFGAFIEDLRPRKALEAAQNALLAKLEEQALTDTLTRLPNRRAFDQEAEHTMARARRQGGAVTIGIADIDHFKHVNDTYGHPTGDVVLCELASIIREAARGTDLVARTGGEEFGLIFPNAAPDKAQLVAERIRKAVEAANILTPGGHTLKVTLSIGLAELRPDLHLEDALAIADAALYDAKNGGRNQVCIRLDADVMH